MSKRAGTVVTLEDMVDAIGVDAARYALARYSVDSPIDLDLDLWTRRGNDNPVYYVQYAHARIASLLRNAADLGATRGDDFDPSLLSHEREGDLLKALAEYPAVVATAAELREPHRVARYLEDLAGQLPQVLRRLPGAAAGRRAGHRPDRGPAVAGRGRPDRVRQRPAAARRLRARTDVATRATRPHVHESCPAWLRRPDDVNALVPQLWPANVARDDGRRAGRRRPARRRARRASSAPRRTCSTRPISARARRAFRDAFAPADVYYAGKAFLCKAIVRIIAEEGLSLDVCSGGELATALAAGMPPERIGLHGNNKSVAELTRAVDAGVGRIIVDSFDEIDRLTALARERGVRPADPAPADRRRRGAHARVHRDRPRGPEVRLLARRRRGRRRGRQDPRRGRAGAARLPLAHRLADLRHGRLRGGRPAGARAARGGPRRARRRRCPSSTSAAASASRTRRRTTRRRRPTWPTASRAIVDGRVRRGRPATCRTCRSSPAGRSSGRRCSRSTRSARSRTSAGIRTYVSRRRRDERQHPLRALRRRLQRDRRVADASRAGPILARVVGKHCESGDIVVKDEFLPADVQPGDLLAVPGTGATAAAWRATTTTCPGRRWSRSPTARSRVIMRRETEDDLLALDVG